MAQRCPPGAPAEGEVGERSMALASPVVEEGIGDEALSEEAHADNPEERTARLEAELAATKASLASYHTTLRHLVTELAQTKQQAAAAAVAASPGLLASSPTPGGLPPPTISIPSSSSHQLGMLTGGRAPSEADSVTSSGSLPGKSSTVGPPISPLSGFNLPTISPSSQHSSSQQDLHQQASLHAAAGASDSSSMLSAMQPFTASPLPALPESDTVETLVPALPDPMAAAAAVAAGGPLSPGGPVVSDLQPYLAATASTSASLGGPADLSGATGSSSKGPMRGLLSSYSALSGSFSGSGSMAEPPSSDVSWPGMRDDQSGSITSRLVGQLSHSGSAGYGRDSTVTLQGPLDSALQQMMQQQQQQQQEQQQPGQPPPQPGLGLPSEGQAAMMQQYAAMLEQSSAAASALPGMMSQQDLLGAMGSLSLNPLGPSGPGGPGGAAPGLSWGTLPSPAGPAGAGDWSRMALANVQAQAAAASTAYAQAQVQAQVFAQVQAAQAQVALEQQQQHQAMLLQQQLQIQYSPYAQHLLALSAQQQQQAARRQGRGGLGYQSNWGPDTQHQRDVRKQQQQQDKPARPVRSRDDPPDWRRIFVGNIGWWVDEAMLQHWFNAFGSVTDTQVMWNTKLLAKGKRVNREFAFISYSTPEEAANAIQHMHGAYVEGLTKDKDGLTVQYEAQGTGRSQASSSSSQQGGQPNLGAPRAW